MGSWDEYFLSLCEMVATRSKDRSTKTGCVVIRPDNSIAVTGYNGFPKGVNDGERERFARPTKYVYTEHCDRNAIFTAARHGVKLEGCTMYLTAPPCAECVRAIIQVGIKEVIWPSNHAFIDREDWTINLEIGQTMMNEAKVAWKEVVRG